MNKKSLIILVVEICFIVLLYLFINSNYMQSLPQCWVYNKTGLLCLGCGATRCIQSILQGDFIQAFFYNMIFFITIVYFLIVNIIYLINLNKKNKVAQWIYPKYWYSIIFAVVLLFYTIFRNLL